MKKMSFLITTLFVVVSIYGTFAQQALWSRQEIVSPEIHADNSVTFRFMASARSVMRHSLQAGICSHCFSNP